MISFKNFQIYKQKYNFYIINKLILKLVSCLNRNLYPLYHLNKIRKNLISDISKLTQFVHYVDLMICNLKFYEKLE